MTTEPGLLPRRQPIQKRSRATVEEILGAAIEVFDKQGYTTGTTHRIAERAGVSIGTLYQYFPNKESIALALLERHIAATTRSLHAWAQHMLIERHGLRPALLDYVTAMLDMHSGHPRLQHMLLEETPLPERVHRAVLQSEREAAGIVAGLLEDSPEIACVDLGGSTFLVVQVVESLTHRFAAHPDEQTMTREAFADELVSMLEAYLRRSPGAD
jgi:AcrR family transcriptional regulator